jgi:outer membrane protein TolC
MKKTAVILFMSAFTIYSLGADKISLDQAVHDALSLQAGYKNSLLNQTEARLNTGLAEKSKLFNIDFESTYRYLSDTMMVETPSIIIPDLIKLPSNSIQAGVHHNFDLRLRATQPIYAGGIIKKNVLLSEIREAVENRRSQLLRLDVAASVKSAYIQYQVLIRRQASLETLRKRMALHVDRLTSLFEEGLVRKTDILETETRLKNVEISMDEIRGAVEEAVIQFRRICGHNPQEIDSGYKECEISSGEAKAWLEEHHPVIQSLDLKIRGLDIQKQIASGRYKPHLTGFAELHYGIPGIDFFKKEWNIYFAGGIVLNIPVFNWNRLKKEKNINEIQAEKILNERREFLREMFSLLDKYYAKLNVLEGISKKLNLMIALAQEDADLKSGLVNERQIPNMDYLESLLLLEEKIFKKQETDLNKEIIRIQINTLAGRMEESDEES